MTGVRDKIGGNSDHPDTIVGLDEFRKNVLRLHLAKSGVFGHALDEVRVRRWVYAYDPDVAHRNQTIERDTRGTDTLVCSGGWMLRRRGITSARDRSAR